MHQNPIDKDKVTETPGILPYAHHVGSAIIKPEDEGKVKSRALSAMREQTNKQLLQIQKQAELLAKQANDIRKRVELSEKIYTANMSFEPFIGHVYHLYQKEQEYRMYMIGPDEWGKSKPKDIEYIGSAKLMSDHTWELVDTLNEQFNGF
ncbi:MAG: DUF2452 domain-containing protein [Bacteroidia bacterium]